MPREHQALIDVECVVVFVIIALKPSCPSTVCLVQTKPSFGLPSDMPLLACQPRSIARETSPGTPQIAVPRQIQRGGG